MCLQVIPYLINQQSTARVLQDLLLLHQVGHGLINDSLHAHHYKMLTVDCWPTHLYPFLPPPTPLGIDIARHADTAQLCYQHCWKHTDWACLWRQQAEFPQPIMCAFGLAGAPYQNPLLRSRNLKSRVIRYLNIPVGIYSLSVNLT